MEITHTQLLNTNQDLSNDLERALVENKLLKKQINKLKIYLEHHHKVSIENVLEADNIKPEAF